MEIANPNRFTASTIVSKPMALPDTRRELDSLRKLDPQAVAAIYDRYFSDVYRYVFYRLGNESLAEDIASDVFVRLLEAVKTKRGPKTHLKGWLLSTASKVSADHLRRVYRRPTEALSEAMPDLGSSLTDEIDRRHQADSVTGLCPTHPRAAKRAGFALWRWILFGRNRCCHAEKSQCREGPPIPCAGSAPAPYWGGVL
jgi:hypothetical protein